MSVPATQLQYHEELGKLHYRQGDFNQADVYLSQASTIAFDNRDYARYTELLNYILRICAEQEDFARIQQEKEKLQDLVVRENIQLTAMTYYTLGLCSAYREGQEGIALEYFQKSLQLALQNNNKIEMCYAIYGLAVTFYNMEQYDGALKELQHLEVFFGVVSVPDIEISARLLMGSLHRAKGAYEKAIELYWKSYELLKRHKNMFLNVYALYGLGSTYIKAGDKSLGKLYLELAMRTIDETQFPRLMKRVTFLLKELGQTESLGEFDLVVESKNNAIVEKSLGRVDFKNQFILLDLLHLFARNPGRVFPKEILVRKVWNQEYDPSVHDNKIYVTIKRLRKLIEPDFDKPKYIFRAKNGYFLNKTVRVHIQQEGTR